MATGVGLGHKESFDCYRGRLRPQHMLWRLAEDHNCSFCGNVVKLRMHRVL